MNGIERFIPTDLKQRGDEHVGPCPFCGGSDRFVVTREAGRDGRDLWICFGAAHGRKGCGRSGDLISFLREYEGLSYTEACKKAGKDPDEYEPASPAYETLAEKKRRREKESIGRLKRLIHLRDKMTPQEHRWWMESRNMPDEEAREWCDFLEQHVSER